MTLAQSPTFAAMNTDLKNKFDSIIFDLDGTLWDSTAKVAKAWQKAKEEVDYVKEDFTREKIHSITGMTYKAIFETLLPYLDEEQRNEFKALAAKNELELLNEKGGELFPGLENTLQYLSEKYKLFCFGAEQVPCSEGRRIWAIIFFRSQ